MIRSSLLITGILLLFTNLAFAQEWETVTSFSGSSATKTSTFTINKDKFRVSYRSSLKSEYKQVGPQVHLFSVTLKNPRETIHEIITNTTNQIIIKGNTHIYKSGTFYFDVSAMGGNWQLEVEIPK